MKNFLNLALSFLLANSVAAQCSHEEELHSIFAQVPPVAVGPQVGPSGYFVESFGAGAYMVSDGNYQSFFIVSTAGVILVDVPPSIGKNVLYAIGNITSIPITHLVYSHYHADHIGLASLATHQDAHIEIIAHEKTREILTDLNDPLRPLPTIIFRENYTLHVGNQTLELSYKGENHSPGNIFIYAPAPKVLMLVDIIFPGWAPFASLSVSSYIPGYIRAHDQVLAYDFKHYIGGHLTRSGNRTDVEIQKEYITDLFNNCKETITLTGTDHPILGNILGPVMANNPGNPWAEFKVYLDIAAEYCTNKTNEKWAGKLGGVDVFGFESAWMMIEKIRLDWNVLGPFKNP